MSPSSGSASAVHPQASIIVLSYNSKDDLATCLPAVLSQTGASFELIVVDNASSDGSATWVEQTYPKSRSSQGIAVRLVRSLTNGGYAAGNNLGAQGAHGQVLVFLNPDTIVQPGWLSALLQSLHHQPDAACACSKVVFANNPTRVNSAGLFMSNLGFSGSFGDGQPADRYQADFPVFAPSGCSLAITADRFKELGGFDSSYFLYDEDLDLGWRAANRGLISVLSSQSVVWHRYRPPRDKSKFYYYATRNRGVTMRKNMTGFARIHLLGHYILFSLALAGGLLLTLRPASSLSVLRGLWEGLTRPVATDRYASPSGWGRMLGIVSSLSITWQKISKHTR